jgi:hypothetical protein
VVVANRGSYTRTNGATMEFIDAALTYFSAQDALPEIDDIAQDFTKKSKKYQISFAGGEMFVGLKKAADDLDPRAGQLGLISTMIFKGKHAGVFSPIILDLDGDGIEMRKMKKGKTYFDVDGDGDLDRVGWASGGDGFLVIDRNGDGKITDGSELMFGTEDADARNALEALSALDNNNDNVIDDQDARFAELKVWVDSNRNGVTDAGELKSLTELGIESIGLSAHHLEGEAKVGSNALISTAVFTRTDGTTGTVGDTALSFSSASSSALSTLASSSASSTAFAALSALQGPFGAEQGSIEALVARIHDMVLPIQVPVGQDSPGNDQDKRSIPVMDGDVPPAADAAVAVAHDRLLALITQNMATFGVQSSSEGQLGWRDRDLPVRFDFFAT